MTAPYQIVPALAADDLARLKASIVARGVEVPVVVDEDDQIIDGHNRAMIADSLGIEYPKQVRSGLAEHEKRLLAVELNLARRHMTDGQKVIVGRSIEADIAKRARLRQAHGLTAPGRSAADAAERPPTQRATDEVARAVGLGSGDTYERGKRLIETLEAEPDGPQLVEHLKEGDWTLDDARKELKQRAKAQEQAAGAAVAAVIEAADEDGDLARDRLHLALLRGLKHGAEMTRLTPEAIAAIADNDIRHDISVAFPRLRDWMDAVEAALPSGLRVVS